jgi:queuine tRNA-ribosyltransferase
VNDHFVFDVQSRDENGRASVFTTPHGDLETPVFAPVGTQATVKALTSKQLSEISATLVLANAYHLYLRPGDERIASLGGLHKFMNWDRPLLTDSGGFQIFSLAGQRQVDDDGVTFRSHLDGSEHRFTPEKAIAIQENLGADIAMVLDECPEPYDRGYNEEALIRTHQWAVRSLAAHKRSDQAVFGIVQGGIFPDLREQSAKFISSLDTPGIAIGGLSVGEKKQEMLGTLDLLNQALPSDKPRYLMGVGMPIDIVEAVNRGVDIFDSVLPTRMARNHTAITRTNRLNIRNAEFANDDAPLEQSCACYTCATASRAYLRHLAVTKEMLAGTLLSIHNIHTLIELTNDLRKAIVAGELAKFSDDFRGKQAEAEGAEVEA